jgi:hypothetical protein
MKGLMDDTVQFLYRLLNHILDRGLINGSDTQYLGCTDGAGRRILSVALRRRLIRWHYVKLVSTHSASYRKTRKMYTITREGIRFILDYERLHSLNVKGGLNG